jgi:SulP family sulfate permease
LVNLSAGSRARLSGIVASLTILLIVLVGAPVIEKVPMAALVGVMIMVAFGTFEWATLRIFNKMPKSDVFLVVIVAAITVILHNLALAVLIGVIISALLFAWESAKRIRARKYIDDQGVKHYEIYGPLFFASTTAFTEKFDVANDPDVVVINFEESRVSDMSAIEALNVVTSRYHKLGKKVHLRHLSKDCIVLLKNAEAIIDVNIIEDPTYKLPVDQN